MARKKKFTQPGETEQRIRWNKAKTRKWLTEYTVLEVHSPKKSKRKGKEDNTSEEKPKSVKSKAKTKKSSKTKQAKRKTKPTQREG